jgi:hypothetical protein
MYSDCIFPTRCQLDYYQTTKKFILFNTGHVKQALQHLGLFYYFLYGVYQSYIQVTQEIKDLREIASIQVKF